MTAWSTFRSKAVALISSGEHYGAVINADLDYRRYLAALAAAGTNYTRLFGACYREVPAQSFGIPRNTLAPAAGRYIAPSARTGDQFDLNRWNRSTSPATTVSCPKPRATAS